MKSGMITSSFRTTVCVSAAAHIALFGGALAFAHFGHSERISDLRAVMVSLVGGGGEEGAGRGPVVRTDAVQSTDSPTEAPQDEPVSSRQGQPDTVLSPDSMGATAVVQDVGAGTPGVGGLPGSAEGNESGNGGGISTEQWLLVRSALERAKTYPRIARERGIEGSVLVRFKVLPSGAVEEVNVVRSSGLQILDDASVRTVFRAAPMPYVQGWVEVPMIYELTERESGVGKRGLVPQDR